MAATSLVDSYLRKTKQRQRFASSDVVRRRAFAPVLSSLPTLTHSGTSSSLPGGSIARQPEECRFANAATFTLTGTSLHRVAPVKSYGYAGDTSMTVNNPVAGAQLLRVEFDILAKDFEFAYVLQGSRAKGRVWVNEQPHATAPVEFTGGATVDNVAHYIKVDLGVRDRYRIMIELESSPLFCGIVHRITDEMYKPSAVSQGRVIWVGDSIGEATWATMGGSTIWQAGGFVHNLGWLLGLHDVWQAYSAGGTGFVATSGSGSHKYGDRLPYDVIPYAPDAVIFQDSTNDDSGSNPASVYANATAAFAAVKAALPDALILVVGRIGVPAGGLTTATTNLKQACADAGVQYVDTTGVFTGSGTTAAPTGLGNADAYAPQQVDTSQGSPHPNQAGHDHLSMELATRLAPYLGLNVPSFAPLQLATTPSGYVEL